MSEETNLVLGDLVIPVGAGRGITQSINPIDNGEIRRTVNGEAVDVTRHENRKYESSIRASDMSTPTFGNLWKGMIIDVECVAYIRQEVGYEELEITLVRDPVPGTIFGYDDEGTKVEPSASYGREVEFLEAVQWVQFRPILEMMVTDIQVDADEYEAQESWQIDLVEV